MDSMLITMKTSKSVAEAGEALQAAAAEEKFGVLTIHDLKATMAGKGVEFGPECRVYEVCNPFQAKRVLDRKIEVSTALPCRISVYQRAGETELATIRPTMMLEMYGTDDELKAVAEEVDRSITAMMEKACG